MKYFYSYLCLSLSLVHHSYIVKYNAHIPFDQAMELRNDDKNCLVARSRCYLQMGDTENALRDAEASMADEPNFFKVSKMCTMT